MSTVFTRKKRILFAIPLIIVGSILIYSWLSFLTGVYLPTFNHYLGLLLFLPIIYFMFKGKSFKTPVLLFGLYLVLATVNIVSFFPYTATTSFGMNIGSLTIATPGFNGYSLLLLIVYFIFNFNTLADIYLDYKEAKGTL